MKRVAFIVFRYLTPADMFNMYKPSGTEIRGGGQSYIDFPTRTIPVATWGMFFEGAPSVFCSSGEQGPIWEFPVRSIGLGLSRELKIYQRRPQTVCIASQKITSQQENRVDAWRPEHGFPQPADPNNRNADPAGLYIFIARTVDNEFWAGWSQSPAIVQNPAAARLLAVMTPAKPSEGYAGCIRCNGLVLLDASDRARPFSA